MRSSLGVTGIAVLLAAFVAAMATLERAAADGSACPALARELVQNKPDTQIQLNIALFSAAACSNIGAIDRHGPHQAAHTSTSNGISLARRCLSNCAPLVAAG